jgi:hypothetical protein
MDTAEPAIHARIGKGHTLQHWGFTLILIGFLTQVGVLFKLEGGIWDFLSVILIILFAPDTGKNMRWWKVLLFLLAGLAVLVILIYIMVALGQALDVKAGEMLSSLSLLLGIILQVWGAVLSGPRPFKGKTGPNLLIERIRRL